MQEIDPEDIKRVLGNQGFRTLVERMRNALTKKVMAKGTDDEGRAQYLAEFHALGRVMAELEQVANSK